MHLSISEAKSSCPASPAQAQMSPSSWTQQSSASYSSSPLVHTPERSSRKSPGPVQVGETPGSLWRGEGGGGWALTSPPPVDFAHFELILHSFCALLKLLAWGHSAPRSPAGHGVCISVFPFLDQSFNSSRAPLPSLLWAGLNGVRCDSNTESSVN